MTLNIANIINFSTLYTFCTFEIITNLKSLTIFKLHPHLCMPFLKFKMQFGSFSIKHKFLLK